MTCSKCRSVNSQHDSRCRHCGRPLDATANDTASGGINLHYVRGNLATVPVREHRTHVLKMPESEPQATLFEHPPAPAKVIPFESIPGARVVGQAEPPRSKGPERKMAGKGRNSQSSFDFGGPNNPGPQNIYCKAPVATPMHRAMAGALDLSIVLIAFMLFALTFWVSTGGCPMTTETKLVFGLAFGLILATYGLFYVLCDSESSGMQWMQLHLTTFDEEKPLTRKHRLARQFGWLVTICSVGLGAVWALCDPERLSWHDHCSKTFPTWRPVKK